MTTVTMDCIDGYIKRNKSAPLEIFVFLPTCPGDQMILYQTLYVRMVQQLVADKNGGQIPKMTAVMINLRTSERFFKLDGNRAANVDAGTLVSSSIVSKDYDFFIVSQRANKGCALPNHYKVIYSDSKLQ